MKTNVTKAPRLVDYIFEIHQNIGERPAGSREEKLAARHIKSILGQYTEDTVLETFSCIGRKKQHMTNLACISYAMALFGYLIYPPAAIFIISLTFISYIMARFFDINIFTLFFSHSKSQNVIARIKPAGESQNILVFSAHIDSPYVVKIYEGKLREYSLIIKNVFFSLFVFLFMISLFRSFNLVPTVLDYLSLISFAGLGMTVFYQYVMVTYDKSFGANDNLSGIAILIGLAGYLSENKLNHTEICLCAFGAEETGSTGSKFYVNTHFKEIRDKAKVINLDSVTGGALYVVTREETSGISHDRNLINLVKQAAKNAGIPLYEKATREISSDAAPFSYEKIPATTLLSLDKYGIPLRYHVKEDLPQYISEDQLQETFKICIEAARLTDETTKNKQAQASR
jgi:hypothetical protein